ncbi:histidine phosphatase family protein [Microbacterium sp. JB110]|uniref:histidine phosphatase family protein n=1 Tax=Microbacterium sp. JB110 TaxID=2024477 RepID=UPI00097F5ED2|nr:histidine phosphatase family protein [Microbacterium sp. JB110]SJM44487.1 Phosphoglycerate mutase [Frigoribacterium sp. JB110]
MTTIALVRHGQTDWNLAGRIQGSSDIPLNDTGRDQARDAGRRLSGRGFSKVVSSTLGRAVETAQLIADQLGLTGPDERIPDLVERAYGSAEGVPGEDLPLLYPHGVPDAEAEPEVVARTRRAMIDLATRFPDDRTAAATHGGVIGRLLRDLPSSDFPSRDHQRVLNGSAWIFEVDGDDIRFVEELSPTAEQ